MPHLVSLLSLQNRSRRNARDQMLLMRAARAEALVAQAHLSGSASGPPVPGATRPDGSRS